MNELHATPARSGAETLGPLDAVRILKSAGGALLVQAGLHGQLAVIALQEEKNHLLRLLAIALAGLACLVCTLLFAGGLAIAFAWETAYRAHAFAGLVLLFGLATAGAWRLLVARAAAGSHAFDSSRAELAADVAMLKASHANR